MLPGLRWRKGLSAGPLVFGVVDDVGHGRDHALESPVYIDAFAFALQGAAATGVAAYCAATGASAPDDEHFDVADSGAPPGEAQ